MTEPTIPDMELVREPVRVELEWIGEGWSGEYDDRDPDDEPLLRFTVSHRVDGEWEQVDDASYCTQLSALAVTEEERRRILTSIMEQVYDDVASGRSIKRLCEELSWLGRNDVTMPIGSQQTEQAPEGHSGH